MYDLSSYPLPVPGKMFLFELFKDVGDLIEPGFSYDKAPIYALSFHIMVLLHDT